MRRTQALGRPEVELVCRNTEGPRLDGYRRWGGRGLHDGGGWIAL